MHVVVNIQDIEAFVKQDSRELEYGMWVLVIILKYFNVFNFMTFEEAQIGVYFRLPGISPECVYRKASSSHCSQNTLLQPIRPETRVIRLTEAEVTKYFTSKQEYLQSLKLGSYT